MDKSMYAFVLGDPGFEEEDERINEEAYVDSGVVGYEICQVDTTWRSTNFLSFI